MKRFAFVALFGFMATAAVAEQIGSVNTTFNLLTANDKIVIEAFDDPAVSGVSCHLSRAVTGGLSGSLGLAEDKSDGSLACRQIGPISVDLNLLKKQDGQKVFNVSTSLMFKTMQVVRFHDKKRNALVYLVYSDRMIEGSPQNAVTAIPIRPWTE
ncbi:MAG: hypothetical protein EOO38_12915 [Cytophagaceae bacterium]|nr:MAG: hypothetical protein EOO38_12915 [Cytophagaceae bacterium]